jgi:sporulation protein YlmC with PRC-barrel domain
LRRLSASFFINSGFDLSAMLSLAVGWRDAGADGRHVCAVPVPFRAFALSIATRWARSLRHVVSHTSFKEYIMSTLNPQGNTAGGGAQIVGSGTGEGPGPEVMAAATLDGSKVMSSDGEHVGKISDIMLDVRSGRIGYAVLSEGGFLGMGTTLHAIPWNALTIDTDEKCFRVDISAQKIKDEPGFDKDHWPSMADVTWGSELHHYYNRDPYWTPTSDSLGTRMTDI